jgi:hypothetical protein
VRPRRDFRVGSSIADHQATKAGGMPADEVQDLKAYCTGVAQRAARASRMLATLRGDLKNQWSAIRRRDTSRGDYSTANQRTSMLPPHMA